MASKASTIATVVIAATIAATLLSPLASVATSNTGQVSVTNETVTANNEFQDLQGYDIINGSVSVNDSQGNAVGSDNFTVRHAPGEIRINNSSSPVVSDGEQVDVSYDYQASSETTATIAGLVPLLAVLIILVTIAAKLTGMV